MPARVGAATAQRSSKAAAKKKKPARAKAGKPVKPASSFSNATGAKAPAVPAAPPPPLTGEKFDRGTVFDARAYLADRLKLKEGGELRLFHHAYQQWAGAVPGEKTWMSTKHSGGNYGKGFYTSTRPETGYGSNEFQVALPVKTFAGKKVYELPSGYYGDTLEMPPGADILAVRQGEYTWFVFKPGSDEWLNASAKIADWDKAGEKVGWS